MTRRSSNPTDTELSVWYYGSYDRDSQRNKKLIKALCLNNCEVCEIHHQFWKSTEHKIRTMNSWMLMAMLFVRCVGIQFKLFFGAIFKESPHVIVIGYNAYQDIFAAKLLSIFKGCPLIFDITVPLVLLIRERQVLNDSGYAFSLAKAMEWMVLMLADGVLVESLEEAEYLREEYHCRFRWCPLPMGVDPDIFHRNLEQVTDGDKQGRIRVVYHGGFIPQHGTDFLIQAAALLKDISDRIEFVLVGDGQTRKSCEKLAIENELSNVHFLGKKPLQELISILSTADISVGILGGSRQAQIAAHNKLFESMAMGIPLVTARTPVTSRLFEDGREVILVKPESPAELAEALRVLLFDPERRKWIGSNGSQAIRIKGYGVRDLGKTYVDFIKCKVRLPISKGSTYEC